MEKESAINFRDQFREGRDNAIRDAENFQGILFTVERLGSVLIKKVNTLAGYSIAVKALARKTPLAESIPAKWPEWHLSFPELYETVRTARNEALHQGAFARHLTAHAVAMRSYWRTP